MPINFRTLLWLLKLGAIFNFYLVADLLALEERDPQVVIPALILLGVSAFRCLFPNRYLDNVVFHDSPVSSIFLTRLLATFSEVAYIYQFSYVIRHLNLEGVAWVDGLSWLMVALVVVSQAFVWLAILGKRLRLYLYEELGWFFLFLANTVASAFLYAGGDVPPEGLRLLQLNLLFGAAYLPWQLFHLRSLGEEAHTEPGARRQTHTRWRDGLRDALHQRNPRSDPKAWGGIIGLTWMVAYWASLIPLWVHHVADVLSTRLH